VQHLGLAVIGEGNVLETDAARAGGQSQRVRSVLHRGGRIQQLENTFHPTDGGAQLGI
jgi:hypothetical protein